MDDREMVEACIAKGYEYMVIHMYWTGWQGYGNSA